MVKFYLYIFNQNNKITITIYISFSFQSNILNTKIKYVPLN